MARTLENAKLTIKSTGNLKNTLSDSSGTTTINHPSLNYEASLTNGVGSNQANRSWQILSQALNSGASRTFDLFDLDTEDVGAGAGRDGVGQLVTPYEEIVEIIIVNNNLVTADGQLEIEPDGEDGWTPIGSHTAANGGALYGQGVLLKNQPHASGFNVTDGSNSRIKFTASGGDVVFSMYLKARNSDEESSSSISSSISSSSQSSSSSPSSSSQSSSGQSSSSFSRSTSSESSSSFSRSTSSSSFSKSTSSESSSSQSSLSSSSISSSSSSQSVSSSSSSSSQ